MSLSLASIFSEDHSIKDNFNTRFYFIFVEHHEKFM